MKKLLLIATVIAGTLGAGTMASAGDYRHGHGYRVAPAAAVFYHYFHPRHQIARHFTHRHQMRRHLQNNRWAQRGHKWQRPHGRRFVDRRTRSYRHYR